MLISGDLGAVVPMIPITAGPGVMPTDVQLSDLAATVPMLPIMAPMSERPVETTLSGCKCDDMSGLSGDCKCDLPTSVQLLLGIPLTLAAGFATYHVYQIKGQGTAQKVGLGFGIFFLAAATICGALRVVGALTPKPAA